MSLFPHVGFFPLVYSRSRGLDFFFPKRKKERRKEELG